MSSALKAIAEPRRQRILHLVRDEELSAGEIASHFEVSRPAVSQHLRVLKDAGLVSERREGQRRLYRTRPERIAELQNLLASFWSTGLAQLKDEAEADQRRRRRRMEAEQTIGSEEVECVVRIEADPETVFPFLTDPEQMTRWMGTRAELDPRPGGAHRIEVMGEHVARGEYVEVDPPRRVVLTWGWEGEGHPVPPGSSTVEISLTPDGDATVVKLRHRDLPSAEAGAQHRTGWEHYLGRLSIVAAGGDPGPDSGPSGPEDAAR